ncbi:MAG: helix-turn-helix transcriptional regulator [bacterium]
MDYHATTAKNIAKYCKQNKLTFSALARKANISLSTLQNILYAKERKEPRLSTIHSIAKALKVRIEELIK